MAKRDMSSQKAQLEVQEQFQRRAEADKAKKAMAELMQGMAKAGVNPAEVFGSATGQDTGEGEDQGGTTTKKTGKKIGKKIGKKTSAKPAGNSGG